MRSARRFRNVLLLCISFVFCCPPHAGRAQHPATRRMPNPQIPQLVDITRSTKIQFDHLSSPAKKYIVESMSGGVALIDYDRDGWPDIYFTNAPGIDMALAGRKAPERALPQQPRWHVYRRDRQGRSRPIPAGPWALPSATTITTAGPTCWSPASAGLRFTATITTALSRM